MLEENGGLSGLIHVYYTPKEADTMTASSSVSFVDSECREPTCMHAIQHKKKDSKMVCRQRGNKCLEIVPVTQALS